MCILITAYFFESDKKGKVANLLNENGFVLDEMASSPVRVKLGNPIYFSPTGSSCDCGTVLGCGFWRDRKDNKLELEIENKKMAGWKASKLERWIEQKRSAREKTRHNKDAKNANSIKSWLALITRISQIQGIKEFGLLVHFYHGDFENENFEIKERIKVPLEDVNERFLEYLEEDKAYDFRIFNKSQKWK